MSSAKQSATDERNHGAARAGEPQPTPTDAIEEQGPRPAYEAYATADDGTRIYFEVFAPPRDADGDAPPERKAPILLVMGLAANGRLWAPAVKRLLAAGFETIVVDNRGCGRSDTPWRPWTTRTMAADAVAVLDELEIERVHVGGASMGGMIAQELALEHPERVASLMLASTTGGPPRGVPRPHWLEWFPRRGLRELVEGSVRASRARDPEQEVRAFLRTIESEDFANRCQPDDEAWIAAAAMLEDPTSQRGLLLQFLATWRHHTWSRLDRLTVPVQVHHGTEDHLLPFANGRDLAKRIPDARLEVYEGSGHGIFDRADELGEKILGFLDEVEAEMR